MRYQGLLLEPFYGGSHKQWADDFSSRSNHNINLLTLPDRHWKWRMHGAAVSFAESVKERNQQIDFYILTDLTDLSTFKSLLPTSLLAPMILYMHENQLTYPWNSTDRDIANQRNHHYSFINYTSMLAADSIWFNSQYHLDSWFDELPRFLKMFPDSRNLQLIDQLKTKSKVIPVGIDVPPIKEKSERTIPRILWNHRWEYDKAPEMFFNLLSQIKEAGIKFELVVLGERTANYPEVFDQLKNMFAEELIHMGYCESKKDYFNLVTNCDLLPVTSNQDFFGISVVEAMMLGCTPLLPHRLAFPEHLPLSQENLLYDDEKELLMKLKSHLTNWDPKTRYSNPLLQQYNWNNLIPRMDEEIIKTIEQRTNR